jgi:hypothetical protein
MSNLKDKLTNWCAYALVVIGALQATKTQGVVLPHWVDTTCIILASLCVATVAFLTGKNPDASTKVNPPIQ